MKLTESQIRQALNILNIPTNNQMNGSWLGILCPFHSERTPWGSCGINIETGIISCFSCHQKKNIIKLMMERLNIKYKEAIQMLGGDFSNTSFSPVPIIKEKKEVKPHKVDHGFIEVKFDPNKYYYTRQRGFTKEFCKQFHITRALNGLYDDYLIIPCEDKEKGIIEFEARRLMEYEKLQKFFNCKNQSLEILKRRFQENISKNKIRLEEGLVIKDGRIIKDDDIKYLLQPKVKYVYESQLYRTIWNIDNLDYSKELYLTEGLGSMPKIWTHITKNCSAVYGSKIDPEQIEILKKFSKIVVIPDNDEAGRDMIRLIYHLNNFTIKKIKSEDTDKEYIDEIKKAKEISPRDFIKNPIKDMKKILIF